MAEAPPRPGTMAYALGRAREAGITREQLQALLRRRAVQPGADRASDRGPAQELDRPRDGDRPPARRARPRRVHAGGAGGQPPRRCAAPCSPCGRPACCAARACASSTRSPTGSSYYDHTFLRALPRFYADLEDLLGATDPAWQDIEVPSFLRMGSWIGGDRDGNPFVTADVTRQTLAMQSAARAALLSRGAAPARRRAVARRPHRAASPTACRRWPSARPTARRERQDEPYRRAIIGIYARLAATAWALDKLEAPHPPVGPAPAYDVGGRLQGRSRHDHRLADGERLGRPGARPPARAAPRGRRLRLPSRLARPAAELRRARARHGRAARGRRRRRRLSRARRGRRASRCCCASSATRGRWPRRISAYGEETADELAMLRVAADAHRRYGRAVDAATT